jgi:hypothetical protein
LLQLYLGFATPSADAESPDRLNFPLFLGAPMCNKQCERVRVRARAGACVRAYAVGATGAVALFTTLLTAPLIRYFPLAAHRTEDEAGFAARGRRSRFAFLYAVLALAIATVLLGCVLAPRASAGACVRACSRACVRARECARARVCADVCVCACARVLGGWDVRARCRAGHRALPLAVATWSLCCNVLLDVATFRSVVATVGRQAQRQPLPR